MAIPALPGQQIACTREIIYRVLVDETISGVEMRTRWNTNAPRYRYTVKTVGRTEAAGELAALSAAVTDVYGSANTFSFTDPMDNVSRTCRLEGAPKFSQYHLPGWWMAEYTLISVV